MDGDRTGSPARFTAPSAPDGHIERARLDDRYASGRGRVVRILAPAGYGKTSLAARWVANDDRRVRWLDVERLDNDPVALVDSLRCALHRIVEVPRPTAVDGAHDDPCAIAVRRAFGDVPHGSVDPFVLVLDDVDRLNDPRAALVLDALVESLPPSSTLVLVGRAHHDQRSIGRFRLAPGVVDVTVDDLAFDAAESDRLLESMGIDPSDPDLVRVVRLLDGWPAGLRLVGRVVLGEGAVPDPEELAGNVTIVDYLRGEWTSQLDADDLTFLREVACLERCTGPMCDRVLERRGCAERLRRLHRDELIVFPLDLRDEWYRLHPLLRHWLSADLRSADPDRWAAIHRSAARYWEEAGEIDRAVEHARRAGDLERCERLATTHGGNYFTRGLDATVQSWLDAFPAGHVRTSPGLCGLSAIRELHHGDDGRAVQWLRLLDEATATDRADEDGAPPTSWSDVLHAALDERPAAQLIPVAERGRANLAGGPWAGFACWVLGALHFMVGDVDRAQEQLAAGVFEAELAGTPLLVVHCLATGAIIDECVGDRTRSAARTARATAVLHECHAELLPPTAPVMAMGALDRARAGDRAGATQRVDAARRALAGFRSTAPWFNVVTRLALIRTTLLLDAREASRALVRELEHHTRLEPAGAPGALACARDLRRRTEVMHQPAAGASALTDAELAVLHHLPTNLSLADIAARLYVSRNTVKSHTAAIYRKLGANSRGEAVEKARAAGLLETLAPS